MTTTSVSSPVIIIGASLAGMAAAITLAKYGMAVSVYDKASFPRRKPCGEGLSARGLAELKILGFPTAVLSSIGLPLGGYRVFSRHSQLEIVEKSGLMAISRSSLDSELIRYARSFPSLTVHQSAPVDDIATDGRKFSICIGNQLFTTPHLIIADGSHSPTLRTLGRDEATSSKARLGTSSSWRVVSGAFEPFVHSILVKGGEIYLTPLKDNFVNISVLGDKSLIQRAAHPLLLEELLTPLLKQLNVSIKLVGAPLGSGTLSTAYRGEHYRGAFVVGDACETFDPCAGFGMTHALLSGRLAGEHLAKAISSSSSRDEELQAYAKRRKRVTRDIRGFTRLTSFMMSTKMGRMGLPLAAGTGLANVVSRSAHDTADNNPLKKILAIAGL